MQNYYHCSTLTDKKYCIYYTKLQNGAAITFPGIPQTSKTSDLNVSCRMLFAKKVQKNQEFALFSSSSPLRTSFSLMRENLIPFIFSFYFFIFVLINIASLGVNSIAFAIRRSSIS